MKKKSFTISSLSIGLLMISLFTNCEKHAETKLSTDQPLHEVTFDLSGFTRQTVDISGTGKQMATKERGHTAVAPPTGHAIATIRYIVYNAQNNLVKVRTFYRQIDQSFGVIRDSLPAGNYFVEILGEHDSGVASFKDLPDRAIAHAIPHISDSSHIYNPELYHRSIELNVSGNTYLDTVRLERVVGTLAIRLLDATVPDSLNVRASVNMANGYYFIDNPTETEIIYEEGIGEYFGEFYDKRFFDIYVFPYKRTGNITSTLNIVAIKPSGDTLASKTIRNIEVKRNKKIILEGYLLTGGNSPGSQELTVEADSVYTETQRIEF